MENAFDIEFDNESGGVLKISNTADADGMNWVEGKAVWGTIKNAEIESVEKIAGGIVAVYKTNHLLITVKRIIENGKYKESYTFKNRLAVDVFIRRGEIGIYTTFNDSYEKASVCMSQRCHTHIWCGKNTSYVNAVKMGMCTFGLGMILKNGSLDSYSVERDLTKISNDRGDFLMHPSGFHLLPGQEYNLCWELFWYEDGKFYSELEKYDDVILIEAENYTVFSDEMIKFEINKPAATVMLNGAEIKTFSENGRTLVEYKPEKLGEHIFNIYAGEKETKAEFFVQLPFVELALRRANFIVDNQQFNCRESALDGAYLIYDNEDKCMYFDELFSDHSASRERLGMGIFLAKYLQYFPSEKIYNSLMKYYRFVSREFYNEDTGEVFNAIGMNPEFKRLYNAPWMSVFVMEMYKLTGDDTYLDKMFKLLSVYYSIGGERFYPNGLCVFESVQALYMAGKNDMAKALTKMYEKHAENIAETGINYPEHEVNYEQSIVTPAVNILSQVYMLTDNEKLKDACKKQLKILEKFNGHQPSHHLNDLSIRHWDGYWFGKRKNYGDTFPHCASIHTSNAFLSYYDITGDEEYKKRAYRSARNILSIYKSDGSASCAYVYPFSVNGVRCEYYDEFSNDQDGFLYYMIKFYSREGRV